VAKATAEEWSRYYAVAARKRREIGGDPFTMYLRKHQTKQKVLFVGSSLFLAGLVTVLYTVLNG
jgi:hypothetical protein